MSDLKFKEDLRTLRLYLLAHANGLGEAKYKMFEEARFTGHMNALDPASPHCSGSIEEARAWYIEGCEYIKAYSATLTPKVDQQDLSHEDSGNA